MRKKSTIGEALERAGAALQRVYGTEPIPLDELKRAVVAETGCSPLSVSASDFSYNHVNRDARSRKRLLFIREGVGLYRFVGRDYPYSGSILWKRAEMPVEEVGDMQEGAETWFKDPRDRSIK